MKPRSVLAILVAIILACFFSAGCSKPPEPQKDKAPSVAEKTAGSLTLFSWWTAGGEAEGLAELIKLFEKENPDVKVVNAAVAGGAGTNAKAVLKTRMLGGDPPETFQVHGGAELIDTWVKPGLMLPVQKVLDDNGWQGKFPASLLDMVSSNGQVYAIPANIHWGNALWINKKLIDENKLPPPENFDQWLSACKTLKAKSITPIAIGSRNKWPVLHLFESLLLSTAGPELYSDLFAGKAGWKDPKVGEALRRLAALMELANTDHAALTWDQACALVKDGKAAMTIMGDWANGYFKTQGWVPGVDYDAAAVPGTAGRFMVITDTFGVPKGAKNKEAAFAFLKAVGSAQGQLAFNLKKGSIPARIDVPSEQFDAISKKTMESFKTDVLVPSCAHGSAVREQFVTALSDQLSVFINEKDVAKALDALDFAAKDSELGQ